MATIEIDGKSVEITPGQSTIIEVADQMGIDIPRFCYHKKLSVAANCRMCLVEVEKSPKAVPACATPVSDGMKVWTKSAKTRAAQKSVMEFLLINHPLDCPICDQGGECELQDVALEYGKDASRYTEGKRSVADQNLGPLIATDMTRCIHCTRCIRFGTEIAGLAEMGATGRGEHMRIGTYIEQNVASEVSGNMIDVCPVGALTAKPYRFTARGWELRQSFSVSPHDALGSHLSVHTRGGKVMRVVPREADTINENWISDRDRFSYEGLYSPQRLTEPMLKNASGQWEVVSWSSALSAVIERSPSCQAWVSPSATLEEGYLLNSLLQHLQSAPFEYRLRQQDFSAQKITQSLCEIRPSLGIAVADIKAQSAIFLVGCDIHQEQPVLALRLRQAALAETKVFALNPFQVEIRFPVKQQFVPEAGHLSHALACIAKAIMEIVGKHNCPPNAWDWLADIHPEPEHIDMAKEWCASPNTLIVLGALAIAHPDYSHLLSLVQLIAHITNGRVGLLPIGANHLGLSLLSKQKTAQSSKAPVRTQWLWGIDPAIDCITPDCLAQISESECVVAATAFRSEALDARAHVYLPIAPFYESGGTFVNMEGRVQTVNPVATCQGEAKPGWKVLRVIGNLLGLSDLRFDTLQSVSKAAIAEIGDISTPPKAINTDTWQSPTETVHKKKAQAKDNYVCIAPMAIYRIDALSRSAEALQNTMASSTPIARLHPETVKAHQLQVGQALKLTNARGQHIHCAYESDVKVPNHSILLNAGFAHTAQFIPYETLTIEAIT